MRQFVMLLVTLCLLAPSLVFAQISTESTGLETTGEDVYGTLEGDVGFYLGERVIAPLFGLIGIIFLALLIYGGVLWMIGGGTDLVKKAKAIIVNSVIGLLILLLAYAFTTYILDALTGL
ncbi:MAG: hypothetical protein ABIA47_04070 [bacterium]